MGHMSAIDMYEHAGLDRALDWHLRYNHVPAIPIDMKRPALEAIEAYAHEDYDRIIKTPFEHRRYGFEVPAHALVEALHLEAFITGDQA